MDKANIKIVLPTSLEWFKYPDNEPTDDTLKLVITKTKAGTYGWNRAWYDGKYWHGSGSMSGVLAWADLNLEVIDEA